MKNPIIRKLVLKARAGDSEAIELLAEAAEEAMAEETKTEEPVTLEVPEEHKIIIDEEEFKAGVFGRLDKIVELLSTAPAGDEEPEAPAETEEIVNLIEEVVEEAAETAAGEKEPEGVAEEVAGIVEAILNPENSSVIEEEKDEDPDDEEETCGNDTLRVVLRSIAPGLERMTQKERRKAAMDIAAVTKKARRKGITCGYDRVASRHNENPADLGKRIMAARNANYHK